MNSTNYLKQSVAWFNRTALANFIYRLSAFCCGLFIYLVVMSLMLILLLLLALYKFSFGMLLSQQQGASTEQTTHEPASDSFGTHKLPALPKW